MSSYSLQPNDGVLVKTVSPATAVYDAVVGRFLIGQPNEDIVAITCGTHLKLFRATPTVQNSAGDNDDDEDDSANNNAEKTNELLSTHPLHGTALHLGKMALRGNTDDDTLVVVCEKMQALFLRFRVDDGRLVVPVIVGATLVNNPIALRADGGRMLFACSSVAASHGVMALHAETRHLQLFFATSSSSSSSTSAQGDQGEDQEGGSRRQRSPDRARREARAMLLPSSVVDGDRLQIDVQRRSVRLGEQQMIDMTFLTRNTNNADDDDDRNDQQATNFVMLYRDRRAVVHVSAYRVYGPNAISLVSRAIATNLERTAILLCAIPSSGGFAVCGGTQLSIITPPRSQPQEENNAGAAASSSSSSAPRRLNEFKTAKQIANSNNSNNTPASSSNSSSPLALWNSFTVGYYQDTPTRVYFAQMPAAVCVAANGESIVVALQNGEVLFCPSVPNKSIRASAFHRTSCVTPSAVVALPPHGNSVGVFSITSDSIIIDDATATTDRVLLENGGPILAAAVVDTTTAMSSGGWARRKEELLTVCGAATDSTFCRYRCGASIETMAVLPEMEGLCNVHAAARSTAVLDVSSCVRCIRVGEESIEEVDDISSIILPADATTTLVLCRPLEASNNADSSLSSSATLVVSSRAISVTNSSGTNTSSASEWTVSGNNERIVAADFDATSQRVVIALHGGRFVMLHLQGEITEVASGDLSSCCITCSAIALAPGGANFYFASWGNPQVFSASSSSINSESVTTLCTLPQNSMVRCLALLSEQPQQQQPLLLAIGTSLGDVHVAHLSSSANPRVDTFSTGSAPVSFALLSPMIFPPHKEARPALLCCGETPCYLLCSVTRDANVSESEVIHLVVDSPLLAAAQISENLVAVVTQDRELRIVCPVADSLLHRNVAPVSRQRPVSHVSYVPSQNVFGVALMPRGNSNAAFGGEPARILLLNQQPSSSSDNNEPTLQHLDRLLHQRDQQENINNASVPVFDLMPNEICAAMETMSLRQNVTVTDQPQQQQQVDDTQQQQQPAAPGGDRIVAYLVVGTRRLENDTKAGGRILLFTVESPQQQDSSNNINDNSSRLLRLAAEVDVASSSISAVCCAFGHRLVVVAGGAAFVYSLMAQQAQQQQQSSSLILDSGIRIGLAATCASASSPTSTTVFVGDALHSVSAITISDLQQISPSLQQQQQIQAAAAMGELPPPVQLKLRAREVQRRRVLSILALDDNTCMCGDEAMNLVLLQCDPISQQQQPATTAQQQQQQQNNNNNNNANNDAAAAAGGVVRQVEKCAVMKCLGAYHIGDRVTTLNSGSVLSSGYTHGKALARLDASKIKEFIDDENDDAENNLPRQQQQQQQQQQHRERNAERGSQLLLGSPVVAGTACGSLLSIAFVNSEVRTLLARLSNAITDSAPSRTAIFTTTGGNDNDAAVLSAHNFRREWSLDHTIDADDDAPAANTPHSLGTIGFVDCDELERLVGSSAAGDTECGTRVALSEFASQGEETIRSSRLPAPIVSLLRSVVVVAQMQQEPSSQNDYDHDDDVVGEELLFTAPQLMEAINLMMRRFAPPT